MTTRTLCRWVPTTGLGGHLLHTMLATGTFGAETPDAIESADAVLVATDLSSGSPLIAPDAFAAAHCTVVYGTFVGSGYRGRAHLFRRRPSRPDPVDPWRRAVHWRALGRIRVDELGDTMAEALRHSAVTARTPVVDTVAPPAEVVTGIGPAHSSLLSGFGITSFRRNTRGAGRSRNPDEVSALGVRQVAAALSGTVSGDAAVEIDGRRFPVIVTAGAGLTGEFQVAAAPGVSTPPDAVVVLWDFDGDPGTGTITVRRPTAAAAAAWRVSLSPP